MVTRRSDHKAAAKRRAARVRPFCLFAYGTLMTPTVFRAVLGRRLVLSESEADRSDCFLARTAVLSGYTKISPDSTYLYAVPDPAGQIRGYLIGPLPGECLAALHQYEGKNYRQVRVKVHADGGTFQAIAFVANLEELSHAFGWEFRDHFKQEVLLREQIERVLLEDETRRLHTSDELTRRALSELHGRTIRDLVRRHFDAGGISAFAIRQAIREEPLREFGDVLADPAARALADNYLTMLLRQAVFNQLEERVRQEFRYELNRMQFAEEFYQRTVSALVAMRTLNGQRELTDLLVGEALAELSPDSARLIDYVRRAVAAADKVYDPARANAELADLGRHFARGAVPMGVELEFSNIGHAVILDPQARQFRDHRYDGFLYFRDFALDILTWKLGGHVDDHHEKSSTRRRRGFFELAPGSLSVEAEISKPITDDPWLLNQLIHAAIDFYDIAPHSLHLSLQMRTARPPVQDRALPLGVMKCLFALAGDPVRDEAGAVRIRRLVGEEILRQAQPGFLLFSRCDRRRSIEEDDEYSPAAPGRWVQQFKFLRLHRRLDYEPIIVALKGLQVHFKPGAFLKPDQYESSRPLRDLFEHLTAWGQSAAPLAGEDIDLFLTGVHQGLLREHRGKPAHPRAYIRSCLDALQADLQAFNAFLQTPSAGQRPPATGPTAKDTAPNKGS